MSPVTPHFANECIKDFTSEKETVWPEVDKKYLNTKKYNIVVQINGKKRTLITTEKELEQEELVENIKNTKEVKKFLEEKEITKIIFIKNKLINLILR